MRFDLENLPSDTALLPRLVREMADVVESRDGEIERLQIIIKKVQRAQFGRRSERLDADQLALAPRNGRQGRIAEHLTRMDFIVLDELGYLPFAQSGGQLLFHLV